MKILSHEVIFSGKNTPQYSSLSFPSICQFSNGTIFASFKAAPKKGPFNKGELGAVIKSFDNGKTWSNLIELFPNTVIDNIPVTIRTLYFLEIEKGHILAVASAVDATKEDLTYYNEETEGLKDTFILFSHSYDYGETFDKLQRIQVKTFYNLPLPLTGAPFILSNGKIGIQFEVNKPYYEKEYWVHHSCAVFSEDKGKTWGNEVVITDNPDVYFWDQRISCLKNGTIYDIFWTFDRNKGDYVNIHASTSKDLGKTFSKPFDISLSGQPGNVIDGKDGELLAIYINRDNSPVIKIAESSDGISWKDSLTVFDLNQEKTGKKNAGMNDVWTEMGAFSIGHPFLYKLKDGTVFAYFYSGESTHRTDFHVVKIQL